MMNFIKNKYSSTVSDELGADIAITPQEKFIRDTYFALDKAIVHGLDQMQSKDEIVPTCKLGCSYCCRFHIPINIAEAYTLAQYVKREFSADQINDLRIRTQQWHACDSSMPGRYPFINNDKKIDISDYVPSCPLLVNGACTAYQARPIICRSHYVSTNPLLCLAANEKNSLQENPAVLKPILSIASPFSMAIKNNIENTGLDFSRSIMLLPHWLAIQMKWDFAISP